MTDLTEQWKKGELPEGDYYISDGDEIYPDYYDRAEGFLKTYDYGVRRVIAEVPDYVEWRNMVNCACEEHEANHRLLEENAQLKERNDSLNNRDINLCRIANGIRDENFALKASYEMSNDANLKQATLMVDMEKENSQLKELLKECFEYIDWTDGIGSPISQQKLLDKIDEALR